MKRNLLLKSVVALVACVFVMFGCEPKEEVDLAYPEITSIAQQSKADNSVTYRVNYEDVEDVYYSITGEDEWKSVDVSSSMDYVDVTFSNLTKGEEYTASFYGVLRLKKSETVSEKFTL